MIPDDVRILIGYRLVEAREALEDANFLLTAGRPHRTIINRCYYAMFYAALALLQSVGKTSSKHAGVLSLFDREFVLKGVFPKELSRDFRRAFDLRQTSDYAVGSPIDPPLVTNTYQAAVRFVETMTKYLSEQGWV